MIARRALIGAFLATPLATTAAMQERRPRILVLHSGFPQLTPTHVLIEHLKDLGYENAVELVGAEGDHARLGTLVAAIVEDPPDVTVAITSTAAVALKAAGVASPIVFLIVADPIGLGLIQRLNHPGGNFTGVANPDPVVTGKRVELLHDALPSLRRMAVLWSRALPEAGLMLEAARAAAAARGLSLIEWEYQVEDLGTAFAQAKSAGAEGVVFLTSNAAFGRRKEIADLALVHQLPSMHSFFVEVADGALMSYGVELGAIYRRTAALIDRILKGARPADLPVEQPTNFTLAINLTTAAALGIELPPALLARADEVIE